MKSRSRVLIAILGLAALALSCSDDKSTNSNGGEQDPYLPRTSPENLLENLMLAYKHRDVAMLDSLLDRDFTFFFSEEDQDIGDRLDREDEIPIHEEMFDPDRVEELILSYEIGEITLDEERTTVQDSIYVATVESVYLFVLCPPPWDLHGDLLEFELEHGRERFWFRKVSWVDPGSRKPIWKIIEWRELSGGTGPSAPVPTDDVSWGSIKAMFRP